jgi:opacity protein-like surface antigen
MKNSFRLAFGFILICATLIILPLNSYSETAQPLNKETENVYRSNRVEKPYYLAFKAGLYEPTDDLEDFDNGFYGEIALNQYINSDFAVEFAVGYFQTDYSESGSYRNISYSGDIDIYTIPITISLKGIIPFEYFELYAGGGIGGYYVDGDIDVRVAGVGSVSDDDDDFIIGGQLFAGLGFDITDKFVVGIEGKYIFTDDAEMRVLQSESVEFNLNGYIITGVIGFRF